MKIKTNSEFELTHADLVELLRDWGTNIEIGEQYSIINMAAFMIDCLNNIRSNYEPEQVQKMFSLFTPTQAQMFLELAASLEKHLDE